ncbi:hypothetical protein C8R44DRAFT_984155 [Mycena epipterygia]|nr:hypothetical protein C8R44DRAFT_984155 [Mycena epipterygia]
MAPVVDFSFGSFRDIITTAQLVVKIVEVLRRSRKSSSACAKPEKYLKALHSYLLHLSLQISPLGSFLTARLTKKAEFGG